ncbi:hypothetical protein [Rhizobium oryzihabitans]|uniref:hypothetical protein n=1 Tax=Rhizobium oryzihabitans TaxID=2267833 RepID=UPI001FE272F4|nr:hypothetical protein [Rhizobium oryzihabitans]
MIVMMSYLILSWAISAAVGWADRRMTKRGARDDRQFLKWSRYNLFGKPFDALLSLTVIPGVLWLIWQIVRWALTVAQWDIIPRSQRVLMIGIFPADQAWRAWVAIMIVAAWLVRARMRVRIQEISRCRYVFAVEDCTRLNTAIPSSSCRSLCSRIRFHGRFSQ